MAINNKTNTVIATGFEAVVGYLYLIDAKERLDDFIIQAIKIIEEKYINKTAN